VARCRSARELVFLPGDLPRRVADHGDLLAPLFDHRAAGTLP
ncbi:ATP-dependent DNA ligase, partial [Streptomyces sp. TRM76130]|nr:ATP-dependent DNA ligase [Streptomyces sp. TRM76130]